MAIINSLVGCEENPRWQPSNHIHRRGCICPRDVRLSVETHSPVWTRFELFLEGILQAFPEYRLRIHVDTGGRFPSREVQPEEW